MQIAFLVSETSVNGSFLDQQNFILPQVFVRWNSISWSQLSGEHHEMLRTVVFRTDLDDEPSRVRFAGLRAKQPLLAFIFLQQQNFGGSARRGCGTRVIFSSVPVDNMPQVITHVF